MYVFTFLFFQARKVSKVTLVSAFPDPPNASLCEIQVELKTLSGHHTCVQFSFHHTRWTSFFCYLFLHQFIQCDGVLRLKFFLLLLLFLQDKARREGVAIDALITTRTLPEPAVQPLLNGLKKIPADLSGLVNITSMCKKGELTISVFVIVFSECFLFTTSSSLSVSHLSIVSASHVTITLMEWTLRANIKCPLEANT